jgi:hypothetical protein
MRRLAGFGTALASVALAGAWITPVPASAAGTSLSMSVPTIVDPVRGVGEPWIAVDNDGNAWITGPAGTSTQTSFFWHSNDGGQTFSLIGPAGGHLLCPSGGGDSEVLIDHVNKDVYLTDQQGLASLATGKFTGGAGAISAKCFSTPAMSADRPFEALIHPTSTIKAPQYLENGSKPLVYMSWQCNACAGGAVEGGLAFAWSANGVDWHAADPGVSADTLVTDQFQEGGASGNYQWHGSMVADQQTGYVFTALSCSTGSCPNNSGKNEFGVLVGKPGTPLTRTDATNIGQFASMTYQTVANKVNGGAIPEPGALFPVLTIDPAGTLYEAWIQGDSSAGSGVTPPVTSWHLYYAYSKDQPNHSVWSAPIRVDQGEGTQSTVFPWIVAGDAGKLGFVWLGADHRQHPSKKDPATKWHPYVAVTTNGDTAAPTFQQAQVGVGASHLSDICVSGTTCGAQVPAGNRNMADFISADIGPDGGLQITWADDANQIATDPSSIVAGLPVTMFARQVSGPKLIGTGDFTGGSAFGSLSLAPETAGVLHPDATGDARYNGTNIAQLDLTGVQVSTAGSDVVITIPVASLSSLSSPEAAPGQSNVWWIATWKYNNKIYFAKAESAAGAAPTFTAGSPASYDRPGLAYYTVPTLVDYRGGGTVSGQRAGNTFVLRVPASSIGAPKTGDTLESFAAYTMLHNGLPPAVGPGPGSIPSIIDATASSTVRLGTIVSPAGAAAPAGQGRSTPATGGRNLAGAALTLLLAASVTWSLRRNRRKRPVNL